MWFNIIGFWAVGFTTGYTLAFRVGWGLPGVWYGILSGVVTTGQYSCGFCLWLWVIMTMGPLLGSAWGLV